MGATAVAGYNVLFLYGLELAPATDGAIIVPASRPSSRCSSAGLRSERGARRALLGLIVALGGLGGRRRSAAEPSTPIGVAGAAIFMAGALCWGIYSHIEAGDRAFPGAVTATFYATAAER